MTYTQVIVYIQQWITDNNNKEITASVMRDVLDKILLYVRDSIGDVDDLQQGADIVDAINILFGEIANLNIDFPIKVHEGASDPNITPPTSFNAPDFYIRNGVQTYIYTGTSWILIQDSSVFIPTLELVIQEGNTTSRKLVGTDYFENKDDNDFAQIKDLEGVQVAGLSVKKNPNNFDRTRLEQYDYCEGWISPTLFISGLWKLDTATAPTQVQLLDTNNWSNFIEIE